MTSKFEVFQTGLVRPGGWASPVRFLVILLLLAAAAVTAANSASAAELQLPEVAGVIQNSDGKPIPNAWVTDGTNYTFPDQQGVFVFDNGKVMPGTSLLVSGPGYQQASIIAPDNGSAVE